MKYTVVINKTEYGYDAHCPALPGCHSQGDRLEEAIENITDAITTYLHITIPSHKRLNPYTLKAIIKDAGLTDDRFKELL